MDKQATAQGQPTVTDDQELAKVLAGMNQQVGQTGQNDDSTGMQFEETPAADAAAAAPAEETATDQASEIDADAPASTEGAAPEASAQEEVAKAAEELALPELPQLDAAPAEHEHSTATASPELETIKKDALEELRPLVDKLDLPADEKFDTLLLIIRSTDDQSLVGAAHDAAKAIEDDTKRAQALLDVIKEIDFFAHQPK